jgi:hypothetical protein
VGEGRRRPPRRCLDGLTVGVRLLQDHARHPHIPVEYHCSDVFRPHNTPPGGDTSFPNVKPTKCPKTARPQFPHGRRVPRLKFRARAQAAPVASPLFSSRVQTSFLSNARLSRLISLKSVIAGTIEFVVDLTIFPFGQPCSWESRRECPPRSHAPSRHCVPSSRHSHLRQDYADGETQETPCSSFHRCPAPR